MVRSRALMESVSANMDGFLEQISAELARPPKKFLRDGLIGLLRAGRPVATRIARKLPQQRTKFLSRLDRLDRLAEDLNRESDLDRKGEAPSSADAGRSNCTPRSPERARCRSSWNRSAADGI